MPVVGNVLFAGTINKERSIVISDVSSLVLSIDLPFIFLNAVSAVEGMCPFASNTIAPFA